MRKQRYSSVPPCGGAGRYGCAKVIAWKRSPARSGAGGGGGLPWTWATGAGSTDDTAGAGGAAAGPDPAAGAQAVTVRASATAATCLNTSLTKIDGTRSGPRTPNIDRGVCAATRRTASYSGGLSV